MKDFEYSLNDILVDTFNYILKYEESSLKKISNVPLSVTEAHMLEAISKNEDGITVSEIASALNIATPTATVAIKKLEKKGFIEKVPCTIDARRFLISLTKLGKKINRAHSIFHKRMVKNISKGFNEEEKAVLLIGIQKLNKFFKEKVED